MIGRRDEQQGLGVGGLAPDPVAEQVLDLRPDRQPIRQRGRSAQLLGGQGLGQFGHRKRVAQRAAQHPVADLGGDRHVRPLGEQRVGGGLVEAREPQRRKARRVERPERVVARGEEHGDAFGLDATRDEGERVGARAVQPLGVVDHAQHRRVGGRLGEQVQHGQRQQPAIGARDGSESERTPDRRTLGVGQEVDEVAHREQQPVQARERQLGLGLDAGAAQDPHPGREACGVGEQGRLPDPGLTAQHQRPAVTRAGRRDQFVDPGAFESAAMQHAPSVGLVTSPIRRFGAKRDAGLTNE